MSQFAWWEDPTYVGDPNWSTHTGFLLAEDDALKTYLQGMKVPTMEGGNVGTDQDVPVWFRYPEGERRKQFPFITIDLIGVNPAYDRWTSIRHVDPLHEVQWREPGSDAAAGEGLYTPSVRPTLLEGGIDADDSIPGDTGLHVDQYLMYELMYQVTVHARSSRHDRILMSRFFTDIFPPRPFWIGVAADQTWRRCNLLQSTQADTMETTESGAKRVFRKVYTITMDAEIPQSRVQELVKVTQIHFDLYDTLAEGQRESNDHASYGPHEIANDFGTYYAESII